MNLSQPSQLSLPPPKRFNAAVGVKAARFLSSKPPFIKRGKASGRYAVGVRYEREVQELLELHFLGQPEVTHLAGPWLEFTDRSGRRWCQPDALVINRAAATCLIAEVKYQHTADAWWQLKQLYQPVLAVALPLFTFKLLEIVHWYDPLVAWPERPVLVASIDEVTHGNISVHICNPKRRARL